MKTTWKFPLALQAQQTIKMPKGADILPSFRCGKLGGGAMLVGGADEEGFAAAGALKTAKNIGRQLGAGKRAEMLDAVDVRKRAGDEDSGFRGTCRHSKKPPLT